MEVHQRSRLAFLLESITIPSSAEEKLRARLDATLATIERVAANVAAAHDSASSFAARALESAGREGDSSTLCDAILTEAESLHAAVDRAGKQKIAALEADAVESEAALDRAPAALAIASSVTYDSAATDGSVIDAISALESLLPMMCHGTVEIDNLAVLPWDSSMSVPGSTILGCRLAVPSAFHAAGVSLKCDFPLRICLGGTHELEVSLDNDADDTVVAAWGDEEWEAALTHLMSRLATSAELRPPPPLQPLTLSVAVALDLPMRRVRVSVAFPASRDLPAAWAHGGQLPFPLLGIARASVDHLTTLAFCGDSPHRLEAFVESAICTPILSTFCLRSADVGDDGAALFRMMRLAPRLLTLFVDGICLGTERVAAFASSIEPLSDLVTIDVAGNALKCEGALALSASLHSVSRLTRLDVSNNDIKDEGFRAVSDALRFLPALLTLDVSENGLGPAGLRAFEAAVRSYPLQRLKDFRVCNNSFGDDGACALSDALLHLPRLDALTCYCCNIGEAGGFALARSLSRVPLLRVLDVAGNDMGSDAGSALAMALRHTPLLQNICLWGTGLGGDGAAALAETLPFLPKLTRCDVGICSIDHLGMATLFRAMSNMPIMERLMLGNNVIAAEDVSLLSEGLRHMPKLTWLELGGTDVIHDAESSTLSDFFDVIHHLPSLSQLDMSHNSIDSDTATAFAAALPSSLCILDIRGNPIGPDGMRALADALRALPLLRRVDISSCDMGPEGARVFASLLSEAARPSLESLSFASNDAGAEGVAALAAALSRGCAPRLASLHLDRNDMGAEGARALVGALAALPQLTELLVEGVDDAGLAILTAAAPPGCSVKA